jgi:hypothetical protein
MHICERCGFCSDCCQCEVPLDEPVHAHAEAPPEVVVETSQPEPSGSEPQPLAALWDPAETQPTPLEESGFEPLEKG